MQNIKLVMTDHGRGELFVDGVKVEGVTAVSISTGVDQANLVTIDMHPAAVEVEGVFDVSTIGSKAREFARANPQPN